VGWFGWPSLIVDCVVVTLLLFPVTGLAMGFAAAFVPAESREGCAVLAVVAAAVAYWVVPLGRWGQTVGMKVLGVRIVRTGDLGLPGYRLAFVALMSRWRPVPALVTVDDAAWCSWRRAS
jgi:uncharacterized RDD family membrane protein YckC